MSPTHAPVYPPPRYGWYVVGVLFAGNLACYCARMIILLLIQPISHALDLSDTRISLLQGAAFSIFFMASGLPFGWLVDRYGRRNVLLLGVAIWSVMSLACGLSTNFTQLFIARVGVGVGEAALIPASMSLIGDYIEPSRRGRAVAFFYTGAVIGTGFATILGAVVLRGLEGGLHLPFLDGLAPWQSLFCLSALPGALVAVLLFTIREPLRQVGPVSVLAGTKSGETYGILRYLVLKWRTVLPVYLSVTLMQFCAFSVTGWVIPLLVRHIHMTNANAGTVYGAAVVIIGLLGALYAGTIGDRMAASAKPGGRFRAMIHAYIVFLPGVTLLTLGDTTLVCIIGLALQVMGVVIAAAAMYAIVQDIVPNRLRGQAVAILAILCTFIGATLGPTAVALVTDNLFGDRAAVGYSILICALPAIAIGFAATLYGLRAYDKTRNEVLGTSTSVAVSEGLAPATPESEAVLGASPVRE
jgi:MFS family permease